MNMNEAVLISYLAKRYELEIFANMFICRADNINSDDIVDLVGLTEASFDITADENRVTLKIYRNE